MAAAHISKLWRFQNTSLWSYYSFHKDRFALHNLDHSELNVWRGTSDLDPANIYNDHHDGFMMQFSKQGFWGRGIYFAAKSSYSHSYAFKPANDGHSERPGGQDDEREMFLAKLLSGNVQEMNRDESEAKKKECASLTAPPLDPQGRRFNTVTGHTAGSQVWVVYENGRAYPDYLVRYYLGERDPARTPFGHRNDAMVCAEASTAPVPRTR